MKEFILDLVVENTYSVCVEAETLEEAEKKTRKMFELGQVGEPIDEGIVSIDLVEEEEI